MSAILVLIGFSLFVALIFLVAYLWAVQNGQYDDKYTPSVRILFDDKDVTEKNANIKNKNDIGSKDKHK